MGCHTWFYKPSEIDTWEKIVEKAKEFNKQVEDDPERQDTYSKQHIKLYELAIENNLDEVVGEYVAGNIPYKYPDKHYTYYDKKIWQDTGEHDIFRIGGYPDDYLLSYKETLFYCKNKNIELSHDQLVKLNKFWKDNPNGMIRFG